MNKKIKGHWYNHLLVFLSLMWEWVPPGQGPDLFAFESPSPTVVSDRLHELSKLSHVNISQHFFKYFVRQNGAVNR